MYLLQSFYMEEWEVWREHILKDLDRLNKNIETLSLRMNEHHNSLWKEVITLKAKASLWGVIGGSIVGIPPIIFLLFKKFF